MKNREIVIAALEHKQTPIIPWQLLVTRKLAEIMVDYTRDPGIEERLGTFIYLNQYTGGWFTPVEGKPGWFQDEFGTVWDRTLMEIGNIRKHVIDDLETTDYELPEINEEALRRSYEHFSDEVVKDKFRVAGIGACLFERAWQLMGMENVLMYMITDPELLEDFLDKICERALKIVDIALEYDIDGVYFADDWGQQKGMIMGPAHWRRFIKPRMAKLYKRVKDAGKFVLHHSCGDCREIFPEMIEIGLDCYQTLQSEIYDIPEMKALYGDKVSFWGGVSTQSVMPFGTPEEVQKECHRIMDIFRGSGGLILAPTHRMTEEVPPENIMAMVEVCENQ